MQPPPSDIGTSLPNAANNSRNREYRATDHLKILAETFQFELDQEKRRCAETGESMPAEWAESLERERQKILDEIQHEHDSSPTSNTHSSNGASYYSIPPIYAPAPRFQESLSILGQNNITEERGRKSVPYPIHRTGGSCIRPATAQPMQSAPIESSTQGGASGVRGHQNLRKRERRDSSLSTNHRPSTSSRRPYKTPRPFLLPPAKAADASFTLADGFGEASHSPTKYESGDLICLSPPRPATPTPLSPPNLNSRHLPGEDAEPGGLHLMLRPPPYQAQESLHRLALSHARTVPREDSTKRKIISNEKGWQVFTEDEDDTVHEKVTPSWPLQAQSDTSQPRPVPPRPPGTPRGALVQSPPCTDREALPHPGAPPQTRGILPVADAVEGPVGSPPAAPPGLAISKADNADRPRAGIPYQIANICASLTDVFRDLATYKRFLSFRDEAAQSLLNFLQTLLDYSQLEEKFRTICVVALLRLSRKSELVPNSYSLAGVTKEEECFAGGHFGEIHKGKFRGKPVCIKVVKMYENSNQALLLKAFSREAVIWRQLSHINVLPFYGIYPLQDRRNRIGLVSPWMEGGNINQYLKKYPDINRRLLISDIAAGLLYLHSNNIVHGDLKGGNILVSQSHRACLADFGLSSALDPQGSRTPSVSSGSPDGGTVRFQAPELIDPQFSEPRSKASDIYAFSLVCYEIYSGTRPFPDVPNDYTVMIMVTRGNRPSRLLGIKYQNLGLTNLMWRLMEDCWEHMPTNRPTAAQIIERLPRAPVRDTRPSGGWGDLSPSCFRASDGLDSIYDSDLSVPEALGVLETIGISLYRS